MAYSPKMHANVHDRPRPRRHPWQPNFLTRIYESLLTVAFALTPLIGIAYLHFFQDPSIRFEHHGFHELAIGVAILLSAFVSWVTWRCYESSGEPFLRWLTLGFIAFTLLYAPHGLLTRMADHHLALFLIYGPASRLAMLACLLYGVLQYGKTHENPDDYRRNSFWWRWIALFLIIDLVLAGFSVSLGAVSAKAVRIALEGGAILCALAGIAVMYKHRHSAPLLVVYAIALAAFMQSALAFLISEVWNHQWWLAHTVFAAGFFMLSYGVVHAYHTTRAFSTVFSQAEMVRQLTAAKERAEDARRQLESANATLQHLASTDALTGASNRRDFFKQVDVEWARARRTRTPLSLLALDLDHFKQINDDFGHAAGDQALKDFVSAARTMLRPGDVIGRTGGEEFMILLPHDDARSALTVAERVRKSIADRGVVLPSGERIALTVSTGCATFSEDGETPDTVSRMADQRLYQAKNAGRNRVVGAG